MSKKQLVWREILEGALKGQLKFTQKDLAWKLETSTSVIHFALKIPREIGAIEVRGRFFRLIDFDKLLYLWATTRSISSDTIYKAYSGLSIQEIEKSMPEGVISTGFTAYRQIFNETPADYDAVMVYAKSDDILKEIKKRFPEKTDRKSSFSNLLVFDGKDLAISLNQSFPITQLFVDLWNFPKWYAKEYYDSLKEKINGILAK